VECLREYGLLAGTRRERRTVRGADGCGRRLTQRTPPRRVGESTIPVRTGGVRGTDVRGATEVDGTGRTDTFFPT